MTKGAGQIYKKIEGLECNEVPDGYVIYDEAREKVHFLNLTAAAVLELCDGESDLDTIAAVLQDAFDLPASPTADVAACFVSLLSQGLVKPCSPSSSAA
jgi:hypothetical protein